MSENKKWGQLFIKYMPVILMFVLYACSFPSDKKLDASAPLPVTLEKGKQLFNSRCISCHRVNQEITGPALKGVETRWPDKQKLYAFIRNSEAIIRNDRYARELWLQYNQTVMVAQPDLTNNDIRAVLDYINSASEK